jgi:glycopeptide antibiotics resistance protein
MPERRPFTLPSGPATAFRLAYVAVIILATIAEPGTATGTGVSQRFERALDTQVSGRDVVDGLRNVLLFAGWGAVWVASSRLGPARPLLAKATITGALLSAAVEAAQLLSPTRVASVLDLITNTAGAFAGALGVAMLILLARAGLGRRSYLGMPLLFMALGYGTATLLEAFSPIFRQGRLDGAWGSPMARLRIAFTQFEWSSFGSIPFLDLILFAPTGILGVAALAELGVGRNAAARRVLIAAGVLYIMAELARGAAGYPMQLGPVLVHIVAAGIGAWMAARWLPAFSRELRGRARPAAVLGVYAVLIALWTLRPFLPEVDLQAITDKLTPGRFIPLMAYRERMDVFTAADVAIPAFLMLPAGALLAVWPLRVRGWLSGVLPAVIAVAAFEGAQIVVVGRLFDVTDILVSSAAALLGWIVLRRAGYKPHGEVLPTEVRARGPQPQQTRQGT